MKKTCITLCIICIISVWFSPCENFVKFITDTFFTILILLFLCDNSENRISEAKNNCGIGN